MTSLDTAAPYSDADGNTIVGTAHPQSKCTIRFKSTGCRLVLEDGVRLDAYIEFEAPNGTIQIAANSYIQGALRTGVGSRISIGSGCHFEPRCELWAREHTTVTVGDGCLFAGFVDLRTDDAHPIFDRTTGARVNVSRDITVGSYVWLARDVIVLKGAVIGDGSMVGARSMVSGTLPANCVAVGSPARVVRENIIWSRTNISHTAPFDFQSIDDLPDYERRRVGQRR